jgi:predicted transcriptional regulator
MKKLVVKKKTDYTVISNVFLRDEKLSLKSKGLLAYVLSLPNDWVLYVSELANHHKDGTSAIYSAFKELTELGYVRRKRERIDGKLGGIDYIISETPILENLNVENLNQENLNQENQQLLNTNNNKLNTLQSNYILEWHKIAKEISFSDLDNFIDYWTEKTPRGKKMRWQKQSTFDVKRRMQRWARNNYNKPIVSQTDHMLNVWQEAKKIINNG